MKPIRGTYCQASDAPKADVVFLYLGDMAEARLVEDQEVEVLPAGWLAAFEAAALKDGWPQAGIDRLKRLADAAAAKGGERG